MSNKKLVLDYLAAFSTGDPDKIVSFVSEDFMNNQVGLIGSSFSGRETYRQRLQVFLSNFQDIHYSSKNIISEGECVSVAYKMRSRQGKTLIEIHGVMFVFTSNGLITRRDDYWDGLSYLKQLEFGI